MFVFVRAAARTLMTHTGFRWKSSARDASTVCSAGDVGRNVNARG